MTLPVARMHDALSCRIVTTARRLICVVSKAEIMTHLMSNGCGNSSRLCAHILRSNITQLSHVVTGSGGSSLPQNL